MLSQTMRIILLGSTGSIGTSTLNCVRRHPDRFVVTGLAACTSHSRIVEQARAYGVRALCLTDPAAAAHVRTALGDWATVYEGTEGLLDMIRTVECDIVVNALVGAVGLVPTVEALKLGKRVALANKESLVAGGELIMSLLRRGGSIVPIDSEHSAILQCLRGEDQASVESIILTASGGPFLNLPLSDFDSITPAQALRHPTWNMGAKITIDSATLVNKGFELIEAHFLFDIPYDRLRVWIHPQSIVHSLVEFHDGAVIAQMGLPNMEVPIQYALGFPSRLPIRGKRLDLTTIGGLTFYEPDYRRFPCLKLCIQAAQEGGMAPVVLNAANEVAVKRFLDGQASFASIARTIEECLAWNPGGQADSLESILQRDRETRAFAARFKECR